MRTQAGDDLFAQIFFAAEKMGATGDVEEEAFRRINHHNRRKSFTPRGNVVERARVFFGICLYCFELRLNRPRIRERHGEPHAQVARTRIDADDFVSVRFFRINRERAFIRTGEAGADQPIRPYPRQINREPPRVRRSCAHGRSNLR